MVCYEVNFDCFGTILRGGWIRVNNLWIIGGKMDPILSVDLSQNTH